MPTFCPEKEPYLGILKDKRNGDCETNNKQPPFDKRLYLSSHLKILSQLTSKPSQSPHDVTTPSVSYL